MFTSAQSRPFLEARQFTAPRTAQNRKGGFHTQVIQFISFNIDTPQHTPGHSNGNALTALVFPCTPCLTRVKLTRSARVKLSWEYLGAILNKGGERDLVDNIVHLQEEGIFRILFLVLLSTKKPQAYLFFRSYS